MVLVALPIPLVSASGLSLPLPGFVQAITFMLVPGDAPRTTSGHRDRDLRVPIVQTATERRTPLVAATISVRSRPSKAQAPARGVAARRHTAHAVTTSRSARPTTEISSSTAPGSAGNTVSTDTRSSDTSAGATAPTTSASDQSVTDTTGGSGPGGSGGSGGGGSGTSGGGRSGSSDSGATGGSTTRPVTTVETGGSAVDVATDVTDTVVTGVTDTVTGVTDTVLTGVTDTVVTGSGTGSGSGSGSSSGSGSDSGSGNSGTGSGRGSDSGGTTSNAGGNGGTTSNAGGNGRGKLGSLTSILTG